MSDELVRDHAYEDNPHHPGTCHVSVEVLEAGVTVETCCGYPKHAHVAGGTALRLVKGGRKPEERDDEQR